VVAANRGADRLDQGAEGVKEPKESRSRGVKEPRSQGAKEPRSQGAKEPRSQGAKEPRSQGAKEPRSVSDRSSLAPRRGARLVLSIVITAFSFEVQKPSSRTSTSTIVKGASRTSTVHSCARAVEDAPGAPWAVLPSFVVRFVAVTASPTARISIAPLKIGSTKNGAPI
jgi:hypothetical protein